ncbi:MAG TPA: hypothetical protein VMI94_10310 [Bryobacteraceae bacterium]|nr:hypothetical protein [Bryobacteraceae bacterium]
MFRKISILTAGLGILSAQSVPAPWRLAPPAPAVRARAGNALRELFRLRNPPDQPAVCSIPLLTVPIPKNIDPMPQLAPPAKPERSDTMDRMPMVKLPAPPCQEEKR